MKRQFLSLLAALTAAAVLTACGGGSSPTAAPAGQSIAQTTVKTQDLSTLVAAVQYVDEGSSPTRLPLLGEGKTA
jgi:ABC-type glycerol-3-phosphate transport system substrate-binding protein